VFNSLQGSICDLFGYLGVALDKQARKFFDVSARHL